MNLKKFITHYNFWLILGFITNDLAFSALGMKELCLILDDFQVSG
ncbi:hypothetical protein [Nostoc sp.]